MWRLGCLWRWSFPCCVWTRLIGLLLRWDHNNLIIHILRAILLDIENAHVLLKVKLDIASFRLGLGLQIIESHDIISVHPLPRRVTQEHLVLIRVYEVGQNLVSQSSLLLHVHLSAYSLPLIRSDASPRSFLTPLDYLLLSQQLLLLPLLL